MRSNWKHYHVQGCVDVHYHVHGCVDVCALVISALYVLVGLTRPLDVLHSDLSREARADLVGKTVLAKNITKDVPTKSKKRKTSKYSEK